MPTINEKLKLVYVYVHPEDGLMISATTVKDQRFDMKLSAQAACMLLGQLTHGVKDALLPPDRPQ